MKHLRAAVAVAAVLAASAAHGKVIYAVGNAGTPKTIILSNQVESGGIWYTTPGYEHSTEYNVGTKAQPKIVIGEEYTTLVQYSIPVSDCRAGQGNIYAAIGGRGWVDVYPFYYSQPTHPTTKIAEYICGWAK